MTVWAAFSEPADVTLSVWTVIASSTGGSGLFAGPEPDFQSPATPTLRVAEKLHISLVTVELEAPAFLAPETTPSYNLTFVIDGTTHDLKSEGLLQAGDFDGHLHEPLGYVEFDLPSFAMAPPATTDLRLLHYSCRRPHERGPDALAFVDDMIDANRNVAAERPHLLFMTGDQIYADDVAAPLLPILNDVGRELMGSVRETAIAENAVTAADEQVEVTNETFPAAFRSDYIKHRAGLTSGTSSHLLTFGEYATMYLMVWSNRLWPTPEPDGSFSRIKFQLFEDLTERIEPTTDELISTWKELFRPPDSAGLTAGDLELFLKHVFITLPSSKRLKYFDHRSDTQFDSDTLTEEALNQLDDADRSRYALTYGLAETVGPERSSSLANFIKYLQGRFDGKQEGSETSLDHMKLMYEALPKVRRAMANVPCYMMWDDHDVTDDWNLTDGWRDQVYTKETGVTVLRNGMLAGALFQLWGNDPKAFTADPDAPDNAAREQFLERVPDLYPEGATEISQTVADALNVQFGLDGASDPPLKWHFSIDGPRFMALVLDTRTRREFRGPDMPPMLLGEGGLDDQIPKEPDLGGLDVVFVVSPCPVLGPPVDELVARPLAARVTDIMAAFKSKRPNGHVKMDVEWWSADEETFEKLLDRLAPYKQVVFLSGDVHHGLGATLDYWKEGEPQPTRFVQFTSSPAKNILPIDIAVPIAGAFAFSQRILRLGAPRERLRWAEDSPQPVAVPDGQVATPALRAALRRKPVLVPTHAWPSGTTTTRPPDSRWRFDLLNDDRPDVERPPPVRPLELPDDFDDITPAEQYRRLMNRHVDYVKKNLFGRVFVLSNNVGVVRFSIDDGVLEARHELISIHPDQSTGKPLVYTIHRAVLDPTTDPPPELP